MSSELRVLPAYRNRTSDIYGKYLEQFRRRPDLDQDQPPLIFWLLAGYFRNTPAKFNTLGLFRVTSSDERVREVEIHMSQANFPYLTTVKDGNLVANYWKRLLREMKEPLIPFNKYEAFSELGKIDEELRLQKIKEILSEIKEERLIYYNTLKFCLEFFQELVTYQE